MTAPRGPAASPAPGRRRRGNRAGRVERDAEQPGRIVAARQLIGEARIGLARRIDLDAPDIGEREVQPLPLEQRDRIGIDREILRAGRPLVRCIAAIVRHRIHAPIGMAVIVFQPQPLGGAADQPGAAAVPPAGLVRVLDVEGDRDAGGRTLGPVGQHPLAAKRFVARILGGERTGIGVPAMALQSLPERLLRCGQRRRGRRLGNSDTGRQGKEGDKKSGTVHGRRA